MKTKYIIFIFCLFLLNCGISKTKNNTGFSSQDVQLIMSASSLKPLRIYKINNKKDSLLLRAKSTDIKPDTNNTVLQTFVKRLYATVQDSMSMGVGIAAPQVGVLKNIIWVQRFDKEAFPFEVYLNPKITSYSNKKQTVKEGCLSIPQRSDVLNSRAFNITIEYDTMSAQHKTETVEGFTSVIFQHEIDHLNGILYLDHLNKEVLETK